MDVNGLDILDREECGCNLLVLDNRIAATFLARYQNKKTRYWIGIMINVESL